MDTETTAHREWPKSISIYIHRLTRFQILIRAVTLIVFQSTAGLFVFLFRVGPSPHYAPPPPLSSLSLSFIPWAHSSHSCFLQAAASELAKYCANSVHILPLNETLRLIDCLSSSLVRGKHVIFFFKPSPLRWYFETHVVSPWSSVI